MNLRESQSPWWARHASPGSIFYEEGTPTRWSVNEWFDRPHHRAIPIHQTRMNHTTSTRYIVIFRSAANRSTP